MAEVAVGCDWLSMTFPEAEFDRLSAWLGSLGAKELNGHYGYSRSLRVEGAPIALYYDGNPGMGIHLQIAGGGIAWLRSRGEDFAAMLRGWMEIGGKVTRCDVAFDCLGWARTAAWYREADEKGRLCSRLRTRTWTERTYSDGRRAGTLYLGSRSSDAMIRIYDKGVQLNRTDDWTRIEIEVKRKKAQVVAAWIAAEDFARCAAWLRSLMEVKVKHEQRHIRNVKADPVWLAMMGSWKAYLPIIIKVPALEDCLRWLARQTAYTFAVIDECGIDVGAMVSSMVEGARWSLRDRHRRIIEEFRERLPSGGALVPA